MSKNSRYDEELYEDDDYKRSKKKESHRRRQPRNWRKSWDEVDEDPVPVPHIWTKRR